jgi:hypothetical protein
MICPVCGGPTYFNEHGVQFPGIAFGNPVEHLPVGVRELYEEARNCCSVAAYTSTVLAARKLLT